jgi:hypothetical protein
MIRVGKRLAVHRRPWGRDTEFYLIDDRPDGGRSVPHLMQQIGDTTSWEPQQEGFAYAAPSFSIVDENVQELFDMLWAGGFRPREYINEASRIDAVNRHLEDMRTIAFDRLKVSAPNRQ